MRRPIRGGDARLHGRRAGRGAAIALTRAALAVALVLLAITAPLAQSRSSESPQSRLVANGLKLLDAGNPGEAGRQLEQARALAHTAGDVASEAEAIRGLGLVLMRDRDLAAARRRLAEALTLFESIHDRRGMGRTQNSLGGLTWTQSNWTEMHAFYAAAAESFAAAGDPLLQATNLRNITFDRNMSDAEIVAVLRRAWEIVAPLKDATQEGLILHQWGDVLIRAGDYSGGFEKLETASGLLERAGTPMQFSYVTISLGRAYRLHGLPEEALRYYQRALGLQLKTGDQLAIAQGYASLALVTADLGRLPEALGHAQRSLDAARASRVPSRIAGSAILTASIHIRSEQYAPAVALLEQVLADTSQQTLKSEESDVRMLLSEAYSAIGRPADARREAERAVAIGESEPRAMFLTPALVQRARIRLRSQDTDGALADAARALDLVERVRATLSPRDELKRGLSDADRGAFAVAIDVDVTRRDAAAALVVAEKARARAFQDLLAGRERGGPAATSAGGSMVSDTFVAAPTIEELRAIVARLGSPMLSYWVAPHEVFIWVATPGGAVEVRRQRVEEARVVALARSAASDTPQTAAAYRDLYDLLIRPVRDVIESSRATRLTIIPHGPLFRVSFAALTDERGRYLVEGYELHYAPAAGVLRFTEKNLRHAGSRALLVADPQLTAEPGAPKLDPLTAARAEVADAAALFGGATETLTGRQASETRVRALVKDRQLLHFATHGIIVDDDPLESYLAFTRTGSAPESDGRLTASEIYGLSLSADLVVLSACRSGAGRVTGDGIIGLARGFFYAGTPSVIATVWNVADEPTRYLMRRFYTARRQGKTKAAALRTAQVELIRALRAGRITAASSFGPVTLRERPGLWAPFVLLGEP